VLTAVLGGGRSADDQVRLVPWGDEREPARPSGDPVTPLPGPELVVLAPVDPGTGEQRGLAAVDGRVGGPQNADPHQTPALALVGGNSGNGRSKEAWLEAVPDPAPQKNGKEDKPEREGRKGGRKRGVKRPVPLPPWPGRLPRPAPAVVHLQPLPAVVLDAEGQLVGVSARLELTGRPAFLLVGNSEAAAIGGWAGPWPVDERWWAAAEARRRARFQISLVDGRAFLLFLAGGHWAVEAVYD